ncbi:MAG: hypothetical protein AB1Z57_07205 [Acidimicrobiia bacterium]
MRSSRYLLLAVAAAVVLALPVVAAAEPPAESGVVVRTTFDTGLVYEEGGIFVVGGPPWEEGCLGEGFNDLPFQIVELPGDRGARFQMHFSGEFISVYEGGYADVWELIGTACAAVGAGLTPPQPIATGYGRYSLTEQFDGPGEGRGQNSLVGRVTTMDGRMVHVSTFAKYRIEGGEQVLQNMRVNYGG